MAYRYAHHILVYHHWIKVEKSKWYHINLTHNHCQMLSIRIEGDVILVMLVPILIGVLNLWIYSAKQNITI